MKKQTLLLFLIVVIGACVDAGGSGPKANCNVQYSSNGVVLSQLKPDYSKTYVGGAIRYAVEVTNAGETKAENVRVKCEDASSFLCPKTIFNDMPFALNPPDTTACIEGASKQDQVTVLAQEATGEEPAYFRVKLSYDYSSLSWSDVTLVSEAQWKIRTQQGIKPVQSAYQGASPIKIELGVPDAPVVYAPGGANEFPVSVTLKNTVEGYAYPETKSGEAYKVDSVVLTAPEGISFTSKNCEELKKDKAPPSQKCTLKNIGITTEEDAPISTVATVRITDDVQVEETYKISAEAKYTFVVKYASPQGVEIGAAGAAGGAVQCGQ